MMSDDNDGQIKFGDLRGLKLPTFVLQLRKNPEKTSPRKPVPTRDRTRVRCVTDANAAAWPTAVDEEYSTCSSLLCNFFHSSVVSSLSAKYLSKYFILEYP